MKTIGMSAGVVGIAISLGLIGAVLGGVSMNTIFGPSGWMQRPGTTGPTGPKLEATGPAGPTGSSSQQGPTGVTGPISTVGPTGPMGESPTGPTGHTDGANVHFAVATQSTTVTFTAGTTGTFNFDAGNNVGGGILNINTGAYTIPVTGYWEFELLIIGGTTVSTTNWAFIILPGQTVNPPIYMQPRNGDAQFRSYITTGPIRLIAGNTVTPSWRRNGPPQTDMQGMKMFYTGVLIKPT